MIKIGLTGSIAMGKSTTAQIFEDFGIPVYDADKTVHQLYKKEAVAPISVVFPDVIVNESVSREKLKYHLSNHPEDFKKLESIIHPLVRRKQHVWLERQKKIKSNIVLLDIPLLFETGQDKDCDYVVVVSASEDVQYQRLLARGNMDESQIQLILSKQMSDKEKRERADFVVNTDISIEDAKAQVYAILEQIDPTLHPINL